MFTMRHLAKRTHALLGAPVPRADGDELRRLLGTCGCRSGAFTLLLLAPPAVWGLARQSHALGPGRLAVVAIGIALASMATGKALGILLARVRLAVRVSALEHVAAASAGRSTR